MAQALQLSLLPLVELLQTLLGLVGQLGDQRVVEVFAGACLLLAEGQNLELGNTAGPGHEVAAGLKLAGLLPEDEIAFLQNVFPVRRAMDQSVDQGIQAPLTAAQVADKLRRGSPIWLTGIHRRVLLRGRGAGQPAPARRSESISPIDK